MRNKIFLLTFRFLGIIFTFMENCVVCDRKAKVIVKGKAFCLKHSNDIRVKGSDIKWLYRKSVASSRVVNKKKEPVCETS